MWTCLTKLGMPRELINMLRCFYHDNKHFIKVKGQHFPSFCAESGIKQGCPLSPLLFAVVVDVFLKKLERLFPTSVSRVFADDIALVTDNFLLHSSRIMELFSEFGEISGLHLNLAKTVLIPLCRFDEGQFRQWLLTYRPKWSDVSVQSCGKYLGFMIGPGKQLNSWSKCIAKYQQRADIWSRLPVGLFFGVQNYNTFVLSVLQYISQLEDVPQHVFDIEKNVVTRWVGGPGNWIHFDDLVNLDSLFSFPVRFRCLDHIDIACKVRVAMYEIDDVSQRAAALQNDIIQASGTAQFDDSWYSQSHLLVLDRAVRWANANGVSNDTVVNALNKCGEQPVNVFKVSIKKNFQKEVIAQLRSSPLLLFDARVRFRDKLSRWDLLLSLDEATHNTTLLFPRLRCLVTPRVMSAVLHTLFNGWCTRRRFQNRVSGCLFGCAADTSEDSIEHFVHCPKLFPFLDRFTKCGRFFVLDEFLLLNHLDLNDSELKNRALSVAAIYAAHNRTRTTGLLQPSLCDFLRRTMMHLQCPCHP